MFAELRDMIVNLVRRVYVSLPGDDNGEVPITQVSFFGTAANAEVMYPYGSHGNPPKGSTGLVISQNANQEVLAAFLYKADVRPKGLKPGEYAAGNFVVGSIVKFDEDGNINITAIGDLNITVEGKATINVTGDTDITTPDMNLTGNLNIDGDLGVTGSSALSSTVTSNGVNISDTHKHSDVQSGASNTGNPI